MRAGRQGWEYKFISANLNAANMTSTFVQLGDDGWEYCDRIDGGIAAPQFLFKRPKFVASSGMSGAAPAPAVPSRAAPGAGFPPGAPPRTNRGNADSSTTSTATFAGTVDRDRGGDVAAGIPQLEPIHVIALRHAEASRLATVLEKVFQSSASITAEPSSNTLIVRSNEKTLKELKVLVDELDKGRIPDKSSAGKSGWP